MLYLIWGLLNITLFVFFIISCYRATSLLKEKFGILLSLVFVWGLFSFMSNAGKRKEASETNVSVIVKDSIQSVNTYSKTIELEDNLFSSYDLNMSYRMDTSGKCMPVNGYTTETGLIMGTEWIPQSVSIYDARDKNTFFYSVYGTVRWKLMGLELYSQAKEFKGTIKLP